MQGANFNPSQTGHTHTHRAFITLCRCKTHPRLDNHTPLTLVAGMILKIQAIRTRAQRLILLKKTLKHLQDRRCSFFFSISNIKRSHRDFKLFRVLWNPTQQSYQEEWGRVSFLHVSSCGVEIFPVIGIQNGALPTVDPNKHFDAHVFFFVSSVLICLSFKLEFVTFFKTFWGFWSCHLAWWKLFIYMCFCMECANVYVLKSHSVRDWCRDSVLQANVCVSIMDVWCHIHTFFIGALCTKQERLLFLILSHKSCKRAQWQKMLQGVFTHKSNLNMSQKAWMRTSVLQVKTDCELINILKVLTHRSHITQTELSTVPALKCCLCLIQIHD